MNWCSSCNQVAEYLCICGKWFCKGCNREHHKTHQNEPENISDNSKLIIIDEDEPVLRKI